MKPLSQLDELLTELPPRQGIVMHSGAAHPTLLAKMLASSAEALRGRRIFTLMPCGPIPYAESPARELLQIATFLPGAGLRAATDAGRVTPLRQALSTIPVSMACREHDVGAVLLRVSPPTHDGRVCLGVAVDYMPAAIAAARFVIAEIDPKMPQTHGQCWLPAQRIDAYVDAMDGPHVISSGPADAVEDAIAGHIAALLDDGAVLQLGVGSLPEQVLAKLGHLKHLGLHTGILGTGARELIERGVIDNSTKRINAGVSVATMALGTADLYAFMHANAAIEMHPCDVTHDASVLRKLDRLCAINSALQIDLDGRVNAEWAGKRRISLPGGLTDFARAATASRRGRSIIALRSTDRGGASNIVARLAQSGPSSLAPGDVDFFVTEFGVAAMRGRSTEQRRTALAAIAHPDHSDELLRA